MALFGGRKKEKPAPARRGAQGLVQAQELLGEKYKALDAVCQKFADPVELAQPISIYKVMLRLDEGPGAGQVPDPGESEELAGSGDTALGPGAEALFEQVPTRDVEAISAFFSTMEMEAGQTAIAEGQTADTFFVIESGRVSYRVRSPETGEPLVLGELSSGEFFGEEALLGETVRPATIEALESTRLKWVDSGALDIFVDQYPAMREILKRAREVRAAAAVTHLLGSGD